MQTKNIRLVAEYSQITNTLAGLFLLTILLTACTAHYHINDPIPSAKSLERYSMEKKDVHERSNELLLMLTFSGGGTRAAAMSYGVLEALADTQIVIDGKRRRLLDEVDGISSVSGGSFTAAYYGLFGDRIFDEFEAKFLKRNVQSELAKRVFGLKYWPKLASSHYSRSDLAADYYDELLFEQKTFRDILTSEGPVIAINATDIALGSPFSFIGSQFAPICSDLMSFPVSRAVTASSAVPGAFTSIILKNHAGTCGHELPEWATTALRERRVNTRRYNHAKQLSAYLDVEKYPYIHLFDGGISDNLGVRLLINSTVAEGSMWDKLRALDLEATKTLAVIVVNARKQFDTSFALKDTAVPLGDTLSAASSVPLDQYSFETMEILRNNMSHWKESITAGRCQEMMKSGAQSETDLSASRSDCAARIHLIDVSFEEIGDEAERKHLESLPTSFHLEPSDVDKLRAAAKRILTESLSFKTFVAELQ
jgi:NTE family protein